MDYDYIKRTNPMPDVLARYGIEVKRNLANCPFHHDKNASMHIYPDGFHCFACGAGGDVITFVKRIEGLSSNHEAAMKLGGAEESAFDRMEYDRARKRRERSEREYDRAVIALCGVRYELWLMLLRGEGDVQTALSELGYIDYILDSLPRSAKETTEEERKEVIGIVRGIFKRLNQRIDSRYQKLRDAGRH